MKIFRDYVLAGYPLLWVETHEEYRAMAVLSRELENSNESYNIYAWDIVTGVHKVAIQNGVLVQGDVVPNTSADDAGEKPPALVALEWLDETAPDNTILFLKDYHSYLGKKSNISSILSRKIRNLVPKFKACGKVISVMSPIKDIPVEIEKEISVIPFKLPEREELRTVLTGVCESAGAPLPKNDEAIIDASLGMTAFEAENAYSVSLIEKKKFDPDIIQREKAAIVRKGGQLEVIETSETMDDIGGLENLKEWLENRKNCFTEEARDFGIKPPKGLLLIGVPGCGKSLSAKAVSKAWGRPLLRLDIGRVMGSYVGESEANLRRSLDIAEAVAPCVLWIDELEKSFAGTGQGQTDGHGTTKRVFQEFLTWLQDKKSDVFIMATANDVSALPPELIRPGRIDAMFWVDLPDAKNREDILRIHVHKSGFDPNTLNDKMSDLVKACEGFSGAGIEVWVEEAKVRAFNRGGKKKTLKAEDLFQTVKDVAIQSHDNLESSRNWARKQGVKDASKKHTIKEPTKTARKIQKS